MWARLQGFRVSKGRGKRSLGQLFSQSRGALERGGPEVMNCTHLFSDASFIKVFTEREKLVDQIPLKFQEEKARSA